MYLNLQLQSGAIKALFERFMMALLVALAAVLPPLFGWLTWVPGFARVLILVMIVVMAFALDYYRNVKPHLDFLRKRKYFFELACVRAIEGLREFDDKARLNVLEIRYRLPRKRWGIFKPVFQLYMEGAPDVYLGMRLYQGVAGEAVRRKEAFAHNLEAPDASDFHLTPEQLEKTKHLSVMFSAPIMKLKRMDDGEFYPTTEAIGILNIDTEMKGAYDYYNQTVIPGRDITLRQEVKKVQEELSIVCSWIMS